MNATRETKRQRHLAVASLTAAFALFDYPLLLHPFSSVYGFPAGDYGQTLWNFWATARAPAEGHSPFLTRALFDGQTASLFYHTLNLFYFTVAAPLFLATQNVFAAFNASTLLADALGLICFYRLCRASGGARPLAVLGAVGFVFCAYRLQHWPTLNLLSTWLIPLYTFALLRLWTKARPRDGAFVGLVVALLLLCDWHYLLFLVVATPFLVAWFAIRFGAKWMDRRRAAATGVACLVALPALVPYAVLAVRHAPLSDRAAYSNIIRVHWSASPLYYVMPGWLEPRLFPPPTGTSPRTALNENDRAPGVEFLSYKPKDARSLRLGNEFSLYLGFMPMVLFALYTVGGRLKRDAAILVAILVFFLLSLGPVLVWIEPARFGPGRFFLLPSAWVFDLPIFSSTKHVSRFAIMVLFLMLILACSRPAPWTIGLRFPLRAVWLFVLAVFVFHRLDTYAFARRVEVYRPSSALIETLRPANRSATSLQPAKEHGQDGRATETAMVFPGIEWEMEGSAMYLQTLHERALFFGYLSRMPVGAETRAKADPFYAALEAVRRGETRVENNNAALSPSTPSIAILLQSCLSHEPERSIRRCLIAWGFAQTHEDENLVVFAKR